MPYTNLDLIAPEGLVVSLHWGVEIDWHGCFGILHGLALFAWVCEYKPQTNAIGSGITRNRVQGVAMWVNLVAERNLRAANVGQSNKQELSQQNLEKSGVKPQEQSLPEIWGARSDLAVQ